MPATNEINISIQINTCNCVIHFNGHRCPFNINITCGVILKQPLLRCFRALFNRIPPDEKDSPLHCNCCRPDLRQAVQLRRIGNPRPRLITRHSYLKRIGRNFLPSHGVGNPHKRINRGPTIRTHHRSHRIIRNRFRIIRKPINNHHIATIQLKRKNLWRKNTCPYNTDQPNNRDSHFTNFHHH